MSEPVWYCLSCRRALRRHAGFHNVIFGEPCPGPVIDLVAERERLGTEKDGAYSERNAVVAALSKLFPAGIIEDGGEPGWHLVYVDLPTGQVSWHIQSSELPAFSHLGAYLGKWDGHSTEEKYARLAALEAPKKEGEPIVHWEFTYPPEKKGEV